MVASILVALRELALQRTAEEVDEQLQAVYELVRNFGGKVVELEGDSVANEIIGYSEQVGATVFVMGQSARSRIQEIVKGSIINRIMRKTKDIDIIVVSDSQEVIIK